MSARSPLTMAACAAVFALSACQTQEQTGGLVGAGGGALLGGLVGGAIGHNAAGAVIGTSIGALGGYFIGSSLGRALDERDRARAQLATQQVLAQPMPPPAPPPSGGAYGYHPEPQPAAAPPTATWSSDHNPGVYGSATVVRAQQTPSGECRTVREVAYISGQEVTQNTTYCRGPSGQWIAQR